MEEGKTVFSTNEDRKLDICPQKKVLILTLHLTQVNSKWMTNLNEIRQSYQTFGDKKKGDDPQDLDKEFLATTPKTMNHK